MFLTSCKEKSNIIAIKQFVIYNAFQQWWPALLSLPSPTFPRMPFKPIGKGWWACTLTIKYLMAFVRLHVWLLELTEQHWGNTKVQQVWWHSIFLLLSNPMFGLKPTMNLLLNTPTCSFMCLKTHCRMFLLNSHYSTTWINPPLKIVPNKSTSCSCLLKKKTVSNHFRKRCTF